MSTLFKLRQIYEFITRMQEDFPDDWNDLVATATSLGLPTSWPSSWSDLLATATSLGLPSWPTNWNDLIATATSLGLPAWPTSWDWPQPSEWSTILATLTSGGTIFSQIETVWKVLTGDTATITTFVSAFLSKIVSDGSFATIVDAIVSRMNSYFDEASNALKTLVLKFADYIWEILWTRIDSNIESIATAILTWITNNSDIFDSAKDIYVSITKRSP